MFLLPFLSDIPPHYYCFCCMSYQIYPQSIIVYVACPIRYTPTILLFLLHVISDIPPQYYCFCCFSYQIYPHNIIVSVVCPIRYTPTILLFLLPVLSDIPHNITVSAACAVKVTSTAHWSLLHKITLYPILSRYEPAWITMSISLKQLT